MSESLQEGVAFIESWLPVSHFGDAPGAIIAASHAGRVISKKAYGFSDIESNEAMTTEHRFRIASQSKTFTATAILQLVEARRLELDQAAVMYVPELADSVDERLSLITIEQLLTHASGLSRDGNNANFWELAAHFPTEQDVLRVLKSEPLTFKPGEETKYSNLGYALLGKVLESVAGVPYETYVRSKIFAPLHLAGTAFDHLEGVPVSSGHIKFDGNLKKLFGSETAAFTPAAGVYSTVEDLLKFYEQFVNTSQASALLSSSSLSKMTYSHRKMPNSYGVEYGYGIDIGMDGETRIIGHGGGYPGHRSGTIVDAENKLVISAFANENNSDAFMTAMSVAHILGYFLKNGGRQRSDRTHFNGTFESLWGSKQIITMGDSVVSVTAGARAPFAEGSLEVLTPIDEENFRITQASGFGHLGETVTFSRDDPATIVYGGRRLHRR